MCSCFYLEMFAGYPFFVPDFLHDPIPGVAEEVRLAHPVTQSWVDKLAVMRDTSSHSSIARSLSNGNHAIQVMASMCESPAPADLFSSQALLTAGSPNFALTMMEGVDGVVRRKMKTRWHALHSALYLWSSTLLPNLLCNHLGDRSEMAHSVEARVPFLDTALTEYANMLPPSIKMRMPGPTEKWVLRQAVAPYITEEMRMRTKVPFLAPPAVPNPNSTHARLISRKLTPAAIARLGWVRWACVQLHIDAFVATGHLKSLSVLNFLVSMVVISERFGVKTWTPAVPAADADSGKESEQGSMNMRMNLVGESA